MRELLTPAVFVVFGIAALAMLATWRGDRPVAYLGWLLFAVAYVTSTALPVGLLVRSWEIKAPAECELKREHTTYIVLTGGASGRARTDGDVGLLHQATFRRLIKAIDLASGSDTNRILISGGAEVGTVTEAQIARQFAERLGWPSDQIEIENQSRDTKTSAVEVARRIRPQSDQHSAVLVTSALHMRRAQLAYRHEGFDIPGCSTDYADLFPMFPDSLLPDAGVLRKSGELWKEAAGFSVYSLQYALQD